MAEPTGNRSCVGRLRLPREPFDNITIPRAHLDSGIVTTESHPQLEGFRELGGGSCASDVGTLGAVGQRPTVSESGPDTWRWPVRIKKLCSGLRILFGCFCVLRRNFSVSVDGSLHFGSFRQHIPKLSENLLLEVGSLVCVTSCFFFKTCRMY